MTDHNSSPEAQARWQAFWKAPLPPTPEQLAAQRPQRYVPAGRSLESYVSTAPRSKYDPRPGESDHGYTARLRGIGLQHLAQVLDQATLERVSAAYNSAVQRLEGGTTHEQLRAQLDARADGSGRGVMGSSTPQERATALGSRFGGREIAKNGGLADSIAPAVPRVDMAAAWQRQNLPAFAQRPEIPAGSSGSGFLGVDNR